MKKQVEQLKLFLESIAHHDEEVVSAVEKVVDVIFESDEGAGYSEEEMEVYNKIKGSIAGGFETLPEHIKKKVAERKGLSLDQIDKAIEMWAEMHKDENDADVYVKK